MIECQDGWGGLGLLQIGGVLSWEMVLGPRCEELGVSTISKGNFKCKVLRREAFAHSRSYQKDYVVGVEWGRAMTRLKQVCRWKVTGLETEMWMGTQADAIKSLWWGAWSVFLAEGLEKRVKQHLGFWIENLVYSGATYYDRKPKEGLSL